MGKPRAALGRTSPSASRIRRWIATAGLRARLLARSRSAAEALCQQVFRALGEDSDDEMTLTRAQALLRAKLTDYSVAFEPGEPELLANVTKVSNWLKLSPIETDLLVLAAAAPSQASLSRVLDEIDAKSRVQTVMALGLVLGHPAERIADALSNGATLVRYQLMKPPLCGYDFSQGLLNEDLERALNGGQACLDELLTVFFTRAPTSTRGRVDYGHLEPRLTTMVSYIAGAGKARASGVNVLLYGIAGTGKSELARLVAAELGWQAHEVRMTNRDGLAATGDERLASFLMAQRFLEQTDRRLVIFDEMEDLVGHQGYGSARLGKLYLNRLLESNAVPTIWIANDITALDAAARRRFDFSIPFGPLPGNARRHVLKKHLAHESPELRQTLLRRELLLPSQVATAKKVADHVGDSPERAITETIDATMRLLEQPIPRQSSDLAFDPSIASTDIAINAVVAALHGASAVVLLYGPPGVGKSALAGHLADKTGRRPVRISASDLLSEFLGENEQRVARLFDGIDVQTEAVIFEEADELLATRSSDRQSWEIRLANELLIHLESFAGLAVLTTNAVDRLDEAIFRRCSLKIELSFTTAAQRLAIWEQKVGVPMTSMQRQQLERLERLAVGDFVAVAAQAQLVGQKWQASDWLEALEKELAIKPNSHYAPRFVREPTVAYA
jgi:transitional endoplasmic reticulum ATPase